MSIRLRCSNGHTLEAPDHLAGTVLECPMCGADIQVGALPPVAAIVAGTLPAPAAIPLPAPIPAPPAQAIQQEHPELSVEDEKDEQSEPRQRRPAPPAEEEVEDEPRRRRERKPAAPRITISEKMQKVNLGLTFFYVKFLIIVVALLLNIITQIGVALSRSPDAGMLFEVLQRIAQLVQTSAGIAGAIFLCFVPKKSGVRPLAIISAALEGTSTFFILFGLILGFGNPTAGTVMVLLGVVVALGGWVTFMIFLNRLALYLDDEPTAAEVLQLMYMVIAVFGGLIILGASFAMSMKTLPLVRAIAILFLFLFALVFQVKFLMGLLQVLGTMRQQIASRW